jgi:hypothetical protein
MILTIFLHLIASPFALRESGKSEFLLLSLLKSKGIGRSSFLGKHALCHEFLKTLLFLMTRTDRVLSGGTTRGTSAILESIGSSQQSDFCNVAIADLSASCLITREGILLIHVGS